VEIPARPVRRACNSWILISLMSLSWACRRKAKR